MRLSGPRGVLDFGGGSGYRVHFDRKKASVLIGSSTGVGKTSRYMKRWLSKVQSVHEEKGRPAVVGGPRSPGEWDRELERAKGHSSSTRKK